MRAAHNAPSRAPGAPLVYEGGRWERMLYDARRLRGNALDVSAVAVEGVVGEHVAAACGEDSTAAAHARLDGERLADAFAGEVFHRLYSDPAKLESPDSAAPWAPVAHGVLDQLPEWEQLRAAVAGDPDFSALAASDVLSAVAPRLADLLREVEKDPEKPGVLHWTVDLQPSQKQELKLAYRIRHPVEMQIQ